MFIWRLYDILRQVGGSGVEKSMERYKNQAVSKNLKIRQNAQKSDDEQS